MRNRVNIYFLILILLTSKAYQAQAQDDGSVLLRADTLIVKTEGVAFLGSGITEDEAKTIAINDAKRTALEQTGTYLESHTEVLNYTLVKDEIITYTGGLLRVDVLSESREVVEGTFAYKVHIQATIDTDFLNDRIEEIRQDQGLREALEIEREKTRELESQLASMNQPTAKVDLPEVKRLVERLKGTDLVSKGLLTKDPKEIIELATRAIRIDKNSARAYQIRAFAYYKTKKYRLSLADFNNAIKLAPNLASLYAGRAATYRALGNRRLARRDAQKANDVSRRRSR